MLKVIYLKTSFHWFYSLLFFLLCIPTHAIAASITVTVNWPQDANEHGVRIYDASNTTAVTSNFSTSSTSYSGSQTYTLSDNTTYTLRMTDNYGDGWNGTGASVTVKSGSSTLLSTTLSNGSSSTGQFTTSSTPSTLTCLALPVTTVGNASVLGTNEFQLTPAVNNQLGAIWGNDRVNLTAPFDYQTKVYVGNNDGGADGITFTLQNTSASALGRLGCGMGSGDSEVGSGISPSLVIELDTYINGDSGWSDPANDHLAVYLNGNGRHNADATTLVTPVDLGNIEDGNYHDLKVSWIASTHTLEVYFDGVLRATKVVDLATKLGTNTPYWGYTASTGGENNQHKVCNQTNPATVSNNPPTITSNGGGATAAVNVNENTMSVTTVTATDVENSPLTYSISGGADAAKFTIDASTGVLSFVATPDYENPTDAGANNVYDVQVKVSDGTGIDVQDIAVTVTDVSDNLIAQTCSGYAATVYNPNTTLTDNGYDGWTQPYNVNPIGGFSYNEFANSNNWMSIQVTNWGGASQITDGVGDDVGYTGTLLDNADWDRSVAFSRIITAQEAGNYRFNLVFGDDHVKIYKNGTQIYARQNAYSSVPEEVFASYALAANDQLTVVLTEERVSNTGLDLQITPLFATPCPQSDYGDAPASYGSPYHVVSAGIHMGANAPDIETSAPHSADALGDDNQGVDDEDGVFVNSTLSTSLQGQTLNPEQMFTLNVPVTGSGQLYAWFDWDGDGTFGNNPDELVINGLAGANQTLIGTGIVPLTAKLGTTYARIRFSSDPAAASPTSTANDGEVEDYQVSIVLPASSIPSATAPAICTTSGASNAWTVGGGGYQTTTSQGLVVTAIGSAPSGAAWSFRSDAMNVVGDFGNTGINGVPSLLAQYLWDTTPEQGRTTNANADGKTGTLTFNFNVPVYNPEIYIDRIGGYGGSTGATPPLLSNSARITPNAANSSIAFTRLGGVNHFEVTANSIQRTPNESMVWGESYAEAAADSTRYMAMGGIKIDGTYTSLSFDLAGVGVEGAGGDGMEFVVCADVNAQPVISSNGGGSSAALSVAENQTAVTTVTATDANTTDTLTYSITGGADAAKFAINASTGVLTFVAAPDYEAPTDVGANNVYDVQVTVSDGQGGMDVQDIAVTVTDTAENVAPVISSNGGGSSAALSVAENQTAVTTVTATDANTTDTLTYSITGGADAAKFAINASTGILTFVAAPDYEAPTDVGANNVYDVQVTVSDGQGGTDVQDIAVTITDVAEISGVVLTVRALLQGPYDSTAGLMKDTLRSGSLLPVLQPYTSTAFGYQGNEATTPAQLALTGNNAVVDWVLVELRDATTLSTVVAKQAALLLRNGDIISSSTGSTGLNFSSVNAGNYYVVVKHRNHLSVVTQAPVALSTSGTLVDFTLTSTATRGNHGRYISSTTALMWAGDTNSSNQAIASGPNNDNSDILGAVLMDAGNTFLNTNYKLAGYRPTDVDMNGQTIFAGPSNDNNLLLGNILLHPANSSFAANYVIQSGLVQ